MGDHYYQNLLDQVQAEGWAMTVPRVLVAENRSALGAGIQSLLAGRDDMEVVGIAPRDFAELTREIRRVRPDVVILEAGVMDVADAFNLVMFLRDYPRMRVMVVSADDDLVYIFDTDQMVVTRADDLINFIRGS
jgi:DNA-binding NarL/FixJ family response regulator